MNAKNILSPKTQTPNLLKNLYELHVKIEKD